MRKKHSIHEQFKYTKFFTLPPSPFVVPLINASLYLLKKSVSTPKTVRKKEIKLSTPDGEAITLTILTPKNLQAPAPCLIYFHGGGFFMEEAPHHRKLTAEYAVKTGAVVVNVHYRITPQYPFPTPLKDSDLAVNWVFSHTDYLKINPDKIAIGGDSAGGTLAASVTLLRRDRKDKPFCFQILVYPVTDARMETSSMQEFDKTPLWNSKLNEMMWSLYVRKDSETNQKYASPMEAESFECLPDAYVEVNEYDPLRDEGLEYAEKLKEAGSEVETYVVEKGVHGYDTKTQSDLARKYVKKRITALNKAFSKK